MEKCPVCSSNLASGIQGWHSVCSGCGYEKAEFKPVINEVSAHELVDESRREKGLRSLRVNNFKRLLKEIGFLKPTRGSLLDVGCAHGWFLEEAKKQYNVVGIEPDTYICETTQKRGLLVRSGYFPDVLNREEKFDIIIFNDVFEHMPNINNIIMQCWNHLNNDGLLVLNLPNSRGGFYKITKFFAKIGCPKPFDRMWQKSLPSPHLHYFCPATLSQLLQKNEFSVIKNGVLPAIRLSGLYSRINYTGGYGFIGNIIIYLLVLIFMPIVLFLSSDIMYIIARKRIRPVETL